MNSALLLVPSEGVEIKIRSYKDLVAWQKSILLTDRIYDVTESFPNHEFYGLRSQIRRAAVSVPSNIAEGSVRGKKEFLHFINIARGSLAEVETQIIIAARRNYITKSEVDEIELTAAELSRILMGLLKSLKPAD